MKTILLVTTFFSTMFGIEFILMNSSAQLQTNVSTSTNPFLGGFNKPKIQWIDWDEDGATDLFLLDEDGRLQLFLNLGAGEFSLEASNFQNINCGGWCFFHDFDNDGEFELVSRNHEETIYLSYYENTEGQFNILAEYIISDVGNIVSESVVTPTFADIDNDGDMDFFSGHVTGTLTYYENTGISGGMPVFTHISDMWQEIQIIGASLVTSRHGASAINFIDLDGDTDLDLSWGDYYQQSLYIIWNEGTVDEPNMNIVSIDQDYPPNDPIETAGQNMPTFADLDGDDDYDLFVTVLGGAYGFNLINNFQFYENVGNALNPLYLQMTRNFMKVYDVHDNAVPELFDIDNDGDLDLFIGNSFETSAFPWNGRIKFLRNIGSNMQPDYILEDEAFLGNLLGKELAPKFADMDNDGDGDLFVGELYGGILYFENTGSAETPHFTDFTMLDGIDVGYNAVPELCDFDSDGDLDLIIGADNGGIQYYQNSGDESAFDFQLIADNWQNIQVNGKSSPQCMDIDVDGDFDLILGSENENFLFYENSGTTQTPEMIQSDDIVFPDLGNKLKPEFFSSSNGYFDMYVGTALGGLYHVRAGNCQNGDLNADLTTNVSDIVILVDFIFGLDIDDNSLCHGDLNDDGLLNVSDIVLVVALILN